jgi:glycosyltransferase involved in cell wall biosynthesis
LRIKTSIGIESRILRGPMTGIANYTLQILRAMLERDEAFDYIGLDHLAWRAVDFATLDAAAAECAGDGRIGGLPAAMLPVYERLSRARAARTLYRKIRRWRFVSSVRAQKLDLFHAFNFLPPSDPGVPVLPVIYDLSTFRHPEFHPGDRVRLLQELPDTVSRAPFVQTISNFSKREIVSIFGYPAERIFVAPPAAAAVFAPAGYDATARDLAPFGLRYGDFFLAVGTLEPRKNIRTLISAYALLAPAERARCPLVVVGGKGWGDMNLPTQAEALRSDGSLRFYAGIGNLRLRSLYEGARLLLMPSIYEGFGMPVVEALACGTAVAHSSGTAMDEISGGLAKTVAALDVDGWAGVLRQALDEHDHVDPALRELRMRAARRFDWQQSAARVCEAYRDIAG